MKQIPCDRDSMEIKINKFQLAANKMFFTFFFIILRKHGLINKQH